MDTDGFTLDEKREVIDYNDIPDIINRYNNLANEFNRTRYDKSFIITREEIVKNDYVLSLKNYKKIKHEKEVFRSTDAIIKSIEQSELQFSKLFEELKEEFICIK